MIFQKRNLLSFVVVVIPIVKEEDIKNGDALIFHFPSLIFVRFTTVPVVLRMYDSPFLVKVVDFHWLPKIISNSHNNNTNNNNNNNITITPTQNEYH
jgi:hypothetical protein